MNNHLFTLFSLKYFSKSLDHLQRIIIIKLPCHFNITLVSIEKSISNSQFVVFKANPNHLFNDSQIMSILKVKSFKRLMFIKLSNSSFFILKVLYLCSLQKPNCFIFIAENTL